jgi:hypothetical protein
MRHERVIKKGIKPLSKYLSETPTLVSYPQRKGGNKMYVRKDSFKNRNKFKWLWTMPLKGFCANVFWWHKQGSFCPLSNLSSSQGHPWYLEIVIQNEGRLNFLPFHVTNVLQLLDCVNENSLILSPFNPFVSLYLAQSIVCIYMYMGFTGQALSPGQYRPQKIQDILIWRDWDSKL